MSHRYGRHGPRAWLRWRKRHSRTSVLPAPVQAETRVIHVRIPIGISVERIILIIMENKEGSEAKTNDQRIVDGQVVPFSPSSHALSDPETERRTQSVSLNDREIVNMAEQKAEEDAYFLTSSRHPYGVYIQKGGVRDRSQQFAFEDMRDFQRGALDSNERKRLRQVYSDSYLAKFYESIEGNLQIKAYVEDEQEKELREIAIQDNTIPQPSDHKRDLGVFRVMRIYNIDVDAALHDQETIHRLVDKYTEYQRNAGREVVWPEATFPER